MRVSKYSYKDDRLLVSRLKEGNEKAFRKLYDKYSGGIYGFALKLVKSTDFAEEITQEVFLKVWNGRESLDIARNFKSYIYTIAKNLALNILNKAAYDIDFRNQLLYTKDTAVTSTGDYILLNEYEVVKNKAIASLSEGRRTVFLMSREQGLSYEEIANELGVSVNTVKTQMKAALKHLREYLSKYGDLEI